MIRAQDLNPYSISYIPHVKISTLQGGVLGGELREAMEMHGMLLRDHETPMG